MSAELLPFRELFEPASTLENVIINNEPVPCRRIDFDQEFHTAFQTADWYKKVGTVTAHQATKREVISTSQDGMINYADPSDWIMQNKSDKDPYVFGDKRDSMEIRNKNFVDKYEVVDGSPDYFKPKGVIKAVQVHENLVFSTPWGAEMTVISGGWVADGGYAITYDAFKDTYEKLEEEE